MSFSFNFVIDEPDPTDDSGGAAKEAGVTDANNEDTHATPAATNSNNNESLFLLGSTDNGVASGAGEEWLPGQRLLLDKDGADLKMSVPSDSFVVRLSDGTSKSFLKIDEERAHIGDELLNLLVDDDTKTQKDLVPRKYEGGLKVWEASVDLVKHLHKMIHLDRDPLFSTAGSPSPQAEKTSTKAAVGSSPDHHSHNESEGGTATSAPAGDTGKTSESDTARTASGSGQSQSVPLRVLELGCGHGFPALCVIHKAMCNIVMIWCCNCHSMRDTGFPFMKGCDCCCNRALYSMCCFL